MSTQAAKEPTTVSDLSSDRFAAYTEPSAQRQALRERYGTDLPCIYVERNASAVHAAVYAATVDAPGAPLKRLS